MQFAACFFVGFFSGGRVVSRGDTKVCSFHLWFGSATPAHSFHTGADKIICTANNANVAGM